MAMTLRGERAEARLRSVTSDETTYQRVFVVETDSDTIGARQVSFCAGLPFLGYAYNTGTEVDYSVRVVSRNAAPVGNSRRLWEVTVNYSSKHDKEDPEDENGEDESGTMTPERVEGEPPEIQFGHATRMKALSGSAQLVDTYGVVIPNRFGGICTSAGEPFDPPPEQEEHYPTLTISRNELNLNATQLTSYVGSVNSDPFLGGPPFTVKITGIDAVRRRQNGLKYWRVSYQFEFDPDTWDLQLLDIGSWYLDTVDGVRQRKYFLTEDDPPQPRLGLLNGEGVALVDDVEPVYRRFRTRTARPFNVLQLEDTLNL